MNTLTPPRRIEQLLESLGADTDFTNDVIGDLAEEFAIRAAWDGDVPARRWYYRECVRVAPHLVRSWRRSLGWRDVPDIANRVALSLTCMAIFEGCLQLTVRSAGLALGVRYIPWHDPFAGPGALILPVMLLIWTACDGVFGGYVAASLSKRAPFATALAVALVWSRLCATAAAFGLLSTPTPAWFRAATAVTLVSTMMVGALLRAWRSGPEEPCDSIAR